MHEHAENLNIYHSACEQGSAPVIISTFANNKGNSQIILTVLDYSNISADTLEYS